MLLRFIVIVCALLGMVSHATAIPQFSALSGNRCSNCHIAPHGGGLRSDLGWYSYNDVGLIGRDNPAVKWLYDADEENTFFGGLLSLGMDLRIQNTRSFSSDTAPRVTFPMQAALYASLHPIKGVTIEGSYNLAALRKAANSTSTVRYPGQRDGHLSAILQPDATWPSLRVGLFRPGIGVRYDDHTVFPVSLITSQSRQPLFAPNWAEYGAEITYEGLKWLTLSAGAFGTQGLSELRLSNGLTSVRAIGSNAPTITAKAMVWPRFFDDMLNTYVGASVLVNGDLLLMNTSVGVGITDHLSVTADYLYMDKADVTTTNNAMVEVMYQVLPELLPFVRWEGSTTTLHALDDQGARADVVYAGVFGAQIFVLPYVELRPEYRMWDTRLPGNTTRWNVQLHIFY